MFILYLPIYQSFFSFFFNFFSIVFYLFFDWCRLVVSLNLFIVQLSFHLFPLSIRRFFINLIFSFPLHLSVPPLSCSHTFAYIVFINFILVSNLSQQKKWRNTKKLLNLTEKPLQNSLNPVALICIEIYSISRN